MDAALVLDIARHAMMVMLKIGAPVMLVALGTGLLISLFQALTQIQELTLTFVPKIIAIVFTLILSASFMLHSLTDFAGELFAMIARQS
ncbi:MAG: flagellar biosynthesis protein FliQ [Geminicoccaceae bacterium]